LEREQHIPFIERCLDLAMLAAGRTRPNPLVGSVIVYEGRIIGEGYHHCAGEAHAEVNAVNAVTDKHLLPESVLYVNLEPCSHHGRTPPCAEMIIESGIRRVVIGAVDSSSKVAGRGIAMLREAGIDVIVGILDDESRFVNRRFFTYHEKGRPYIVLKWAMSADRFIDVHRAPGTPAEPWWVTGMEERVLVHRWRTAEQAIMAGGATVRTDNPSLNVRYVEGLQPLKVIISKSADMDAASNVFNGDSGVLLITENREAAFRNTTVVAERFGGEDFGQRICDILHQHDIQSLFVEGGRRVHDLFLLSGIWDEIRVFTGREAWGSGKEAPVPSGKLVRQEEFEKSTLEWFVNEITGVKDSWFKYF
jgi:diaminohydroxyphosphoribosylaminopyrimidine deaminase / 5-amino-6-(5-phosphoribosylamino)uracil reductase